MESVPLKVKRPFFASGARCTDFIIPREVYVEDEIPASPNVVVSIAPTHPHCAFTQVSDDSYKRTPKKPHKKKRSASSFSAIFNGKKHTLCLQDAEIEFANGKCSIKGQAAFLREVCPGGISLHSFLENGARCTDFIIPREVYVEDEIPASPNVAVSIAPTHPHRAFTQVSDDSYKRTPKKPHKKKHYPHITPEQNTRRIKNNRTTRSLQVIGYRARRSSFRYFEMEGSASSFSATFNGKKHTLCLQDAEIEFANGKCSIKGQAAFLLEVCPGGISLRSFSENGARCTDFIIQREVYVEDEIPASPNVVVSIAPTHPHRAFTQVSDDSYKRTPNKPHKKKRKEVSNSVEC
ncbi:hypothetical protein NC651_021660 [Populus alba x Populus x berolinensis]|nr:hypothetical protein NC651_021660 [Populus alba x Populus x berolinensis]